MANVAHSSLSGGNLHENKDHSIEDHTDVDSSMTPSNGQLLRFYTSNDEWTADGLDLEDLGDVDLTSPVPSDGDYLRYDSASGKWKPSST